MKVTTLRLPPYLLAALESEAARAGLSLSELIRAKLIHAQAHDDQVMAHLGIMLRESIVAKKLAARTLFGHFESQGPVNKDEFRELMQRFQGEAQTIVDKMRS